MMDEEKQKKLEQKQASQSLEKEIIQTKNPKKKLSDILKTGPVMNAEGYGNYKHLKKDFDKWLKKLL